MERTYSISGMTCEGCAVSVKQKLSDITGVNRVEVDLRQAKAAIQMKEQLPISAFRAVLSHPYGIEEKAASVSETVTQKERSKWAQLRPLLLIFAYLVAATLLLNCNDWQLQEAMLNFMGLFYMVFSFFKFLDLKGFPKSFAQYDPLARAIPFYGWLYPFLELALGLAFLLRFQVPIALGATLLILGITTVGVVRTLLDRKTIRCACLGTALKLPMTEATLIENAVMLVMAGWMLVVL